MAHLPLVLTSVEDGLDREDRNNFLLVALNVVLEVE